MAPEIPSQFRFEELLSSTFPGFFSAITLFMLIDFLSPINLTSWAIKDTTSLLSFVGFVVLVGTIVGIIIDGIHHSIIEDIIFKNILGLKEIDESLKALYIVDLKLTHHYFFKKLGDKAENIFEYLINSRYRYSEFYANTFISLVSFSFVIPFYLNDSFQVSWILSILLAFISLIISYVCLNSSFEAFKAYQEAKFSVICGYLDYPFYINLRAEVYLFTWEDFSEKDYDTLIDFIEQNFDVNWIKKEKISKINDGKTIKISDINDSRSIELNIEKNTVQFKINGCITDEFIVKIEEHKQKIYAYAEKIPRSRKVCTLVAAVTYKASKRPLLKGGIEVIFKTTLGNIDPKINVKTDNFGIAKANICSDKCGISIVTAASKDCIPGITKVHFRLFRDIQSCL